MEQQIKCRNCKFWNPPEYDDKFGKCSNKILNGRNHKSGFDGVQLLSVDGKFMYTGQNFGCIYFSKK